MDNEFHIKLMMIKYTKKHKESHKINDVFYFQSL